MLTMTLLIGVAAYRAWRLIAVDTILEEPRNKFYEWAEDSRFGWWLAELVGCVWCLGFWIAGGMTATAALALDWDLLVSLVVVWPAASAVAGLVGRLDPSS